MSLTLGKQFNRSYNMRLPFLNGYYNIYIYFNKKSPFVLYNLEPDFSDTNVTKSVNVNMFKNLSASMFCETFIKLHNFKKSTLDIVNQFHEVKPEFNSDISFICNESINLLKIETDDKVLYDTLTVYGFVFNSYISEFLFIISERQNINQQLGKKFVRTTGLQISTMDASNFLKESNKRLKEGNIPGLYKEDKSNEVINFTELNESD